MPRAFCICAQRRPRDFAFFLVAFGRGRAVSKPKAAEHRRTPKRKRHTTPATPHAAFPSRKRSLIRCRGSVLECASALALLVGRTRGRQPKAAERPPFAEPPSLKVRACDGLWHGRPPHSKTHASHNAPCHTTRGFPNQCSISLINSMPTRLVRMVPGSARSGNSCRNQEWKPILHENFLWTLSMETVSMKNLFRSIERR